MVMGKLKENHIATADFARKYISVYHKIIGHDTELAVAEIDWVTPEGIKPLTVDLTNMTDHEAIEVAKAMMIAARDMGHDNGMVQ